MLTTAAEKTHGYSEKEFEMFVTATGIMYLTVHNIVYNIDLDGNYIVRRKSDGMVIDEEIDPTTTEEEMAKLTSADALFGA